MDIILPEYPDIVVPKLETIDEVVSSVKQGIAEKTGFTLTDAVCPIEEFDLRVGFQRAIYLDETFGRMQVIAIAQTKELLFDLFTDLVEELFGIEAFGHAGIDAVLESRHIPDKVCVGKKYDASGRARYYRDYMAEKIDPIPFLSRLYDFEDLLMNDGFAGVSLMSDSSLSELRFDVHKAILFFSKHKKLLGRIVSFLLNAGIPQFEDATTVAEKPHIHLGDSSLNDSFRQFVTLTGAKRVA